MPDNFTCGRRYEGIGYGVKNADSWVPWPGQPGRLMCSYCGSMRPEAVFAAIEAGGRITPTDKNYKIYVQVDEHEEKFYFQHFDEAQKMRFIILLNENKIIFSAPGYFYNMPFFIKTMRPSDG